MLTVNGRTERTKHENANSHPTVELRKACFSILEMTTKLIIYRANAAAEVTWQRQAYSSEMSSLTQIFSV
jgi:hypothetical protein